MKIDVLLGLQWGDEGKGKIVDVLTPDYDIVDRFVNKKLFYFDSKSRKWAPKFTVGKDFKE